jgi:hypothetical protein
MLIGDNKGLDRMVTAARKYCHPKVSPRSSQPPTAVTTTQAALRTHQKVTRSDQVDPKLPMTIMILWLFSLESSLSIEMLKVAEPKTLQRRRLLKGEHDECEYKKLLTHIIVSMLVSMMKVEGLMARARRLLAARRRLISSSNFTLLLTPSYNRKMVTSFFRRGL